MSQDQIESIARTALKVVAGACATYGYTKLGTLVNTPDVVALVALAVGAAWSWTHHSNNPTIKQ